LKQWEEEIVEIHIHKIKEKDLVEIKVEVVEIIVEEEVHSIKGVIDFRLINSRNDRIFG